MCFSKQDRLALLPKERYLSFFGCALSSVPRGKYVCQLGQVKRFQVDNIHPSVVRACCNMCLLFKGQLGNERAGEASSKPFSSRYFPCDSPG